MKTLSIALVLTTALTGLGLAGCQTVDDDGYYDSSYSSPVYSESYVYQDYGSYRSAPRYVERSYRPAPRWSGEHRPPPPQWQPQRPPHQPTQWQQPQQPPRQPPQWQQPRQPSAAPRQPTQGWGGRPQNDRPPPRPQYEPSN